MPATVDIQISITESIPEVKRAVRFLARLLQMQNEGSSVTLNWGEDNGCWEASWITGDRRYTGFSTDPTKALEEAMCAAVGPAALNYAALSEPRPGGPN